MALRDYIVKATSHLEVELDKVGNVLGRTRHPQGSKVTLEEGEAKRLVDTGGLVLASDAEGSSDDTEEPTPAEGTGDTPEVTEGAEDGSGDTPDTDGTDYESMDYATLQRVAKARTGNGGGSTADLVARLKAHDDEVAATA